MTPAGFRHVQRALDERRQRALLAAIRKVLGVAPLFKPVMPRTGRPFSVNMTNCGPLGWVSDREGGYRYQPNHPVTCLAWPPIPTIVLRLWGEYSGFPAQPEACLINTYATSARMGSHRDSDEAEMRAPVLSVSLGDDAVFHIGGLRRSDAKTRLVLKSGDVVVLGGESRLAFHGIDRILPGTSSLLPAGGRINLTLRRVTLAESSARRLPA